MGLLAAVLSLPVPPLSLLFLMVAAPEEEVQVSTADRRRSLPSGHLFSDVGAMLREVGRGEAGDSETPAAERSGTECEAVLHWEATREPESGHHCK